MGWPESSPPISPCKHLGARKVSARDLGLFPRFHSPSALVDRDRRRIQAPSKRSCSNRPNPKWRSGGTTRNATDLLIQDWGRNLPSQSSFSSMAGTLRDDWYTPESAIFRRQREFRVSPTTAAGLRQRSSQTGDGAHEHGSYAPSPRRSLEHLDLRTAIHVGAFRPAAAKPVRYGVARTRPRNRVEPKLGAPDQSRPPPHAEDLRQSLAALPIDGGLESDSAPGQLAANRAQFLLRFREAVPFSTAYNRPGARPSPR